MEYPPSNELIHKNATLEALKVLAITWNVNAKVEQKREIRNLLFSGENADSYLDFPEIVVVGLQEVVELSTSNVVGSAIAGQCKERVNKWQELIMETFQAEKLKYDCVASNNLVGLWIGVFVAHKQRSLISKVQVSCFARGVGGVLGNKGAVYVRMNILDTSVCFVNAHFAAHREQVQKRNEDFHAILNHKCFPDFLNTGMEQLFSTHVKAPEVVKLQENLTEMKRKIASMTTAQGITYNPIKIASPVKDANSSCESRFDHCNTALLPRHSADDHDVIIWMGDLNYRIVTGIDTSVVYDMIESKRSIYLAPYDQLNQEREKGEVFNYFNEGLLTFEPTYKYIPGKDCYDNRKEKKLRCPAWCDRVLWRIGKNLASVAEVFDNDTDDESGSDNDHTAEENEANNMNDSSSTGANSNQETTVTMLELVKSNSALEVELNLDSELSGMTALNLGPNAPALISSPLSAEAGSHKSLSAKLSGSGWDNEKRARMSGKVSAQKATELEYGCSESVELMMYDRCANTISDHKPVRAILNMKVKRVNWAACEQARIDAYALTCSTTAPFTNRSCHYANHNSLPALTVAPRTIKFYSMLDAAASPRSAKLSINSCHFELSNNMTSTDMRFSVVSTSIPSWLVLSRTTGVIAAQTSMTVEVSADQGAVNVWAKGMRDVNRSYLDMPTLSRFIQNSGANNYNDRSIEVYAMLEITVHAATDSSNSNNSSGKINGNGGDVEKVSGSACVTINYAGDNILVPIVCCAEHNAATSSSTSQYATPSLSPLPLSPLPPSTVAAAVV